MRNEAEIWRELQTKREQMIEVGLRLGLAHPETVRLSQEVDALHNEHMHASFDTLAKIKKAEVLPC